MIKSLLKDEENQPNDVQADSESEQTKETMLESLPEATAKQTSANSFDSADSKDVYNFTLVETLPKDDDKPMFQTNFKPESTAETIRKSGLAYAAAITLFGSIVFLLIIGWFADLLFGTSPWGIVGGIVLGSIVGFLQFFRITSQILKNKD